ncbi:50S ribosomal protein L3 [Candidatus Tremblaya phenacola]|uniref:50S ribosomal protein L3 n=1 Tax=Candidatus Tremblayella phenacoccinincola TaxID=1010676 RepID=UPI001330532D|nr:50S ribosomal protein L3 [Candidatus Tremblaya phenacola]KAH0998266.1 LSU ribosomal protein L3p [Candidatus Tremblaya phenacola]
MEALYLPCVKLGMTRIYKKDGEVIPASILNTSGNFLSQRNPTEQKVHLIFSERTKPRMNRAQLGQYLKYNCCLGNTLKVSKALKELCKDLFNNEGFPLSKALYVGRKINVKGRCIGKGFAGTIKRYNFNSGRATHGNSKSHNVPGSTGMNQSPGKVFKRKKMPGHLGTNLVTVKNLEICYVSRTLGFVLVKGAVPGFKGSRLSMRLV